MIEEDEVEDDATDADYVPTSKNARKSTSLQDQETVVPPAQPPDGQTTSNNITPSTTESQGALEQLTPSDEQMLLQQINETL